MKLAILTTLALLTVPFAANAGTFTVEAEVSKVIVMGGKSTVNVPVEKCDIVRVPITETRRSGGGSGDALAGMIIGGLIGKGATGNDRGAAIGAIIGGMAGADGKSYEVVTGYRNERQCYQTYTTKVVDVIDGYEVYYEWNGLSGHVFTSNEYRVGDTILINVTMN